MARYDRRRPISCGCLKNKSGSNRLGEYERSMGEIGSMGEQAYRSEMAIHSFVEIWAPSSGLRYAESLVLNNA